jgi:hypothetical protein
MRSAFFMSSIASGKHQSVATRPWLLLLLLRHFGASRCRSRTAEGAIVTVGRRRALAEMMEEAIA